jgi:L-threonylcarbamoyladenylate synthase
MPIVPATPDTIADAARFLRQGGLVAFPTETVYGLGGDATNDLAVAAIFSAKGRPTFNPLIVHVPGLKAAERFGRFDARATILAKAFWPGPLTLVVPRLDPCPISLLVTAGLDTLAIRCPAHPIALDLMMQTRTPIAAPSANRSGHVSPTTAQHVADDLGAEIDLILDGGPTEVGLESTVVDMAGPRVRIIRPGAVTAAELEAALGETVETAVVVDDATPSAPGQLASHYAPRAELRLNANDVRPGEALLTFGPSTLAASHMRALSPKGDVMEAAANLFAALRALDATGVVTIAVTPIPNDGVGIAINDRLRRAAAPR